MCMTKSASGNVRVSEKGRYLEIKHAGFVRVLEFGILSSLLEETVKLFLPISDLFPESRISGSKQYLKELVIRRLGLELTAVLDGLLECWGLCDGHGW